MCDILRIALNSSKQMQVPCYDALLQLINMLLAKFSCRHAMFAAEPCGNANSLTDRAQGIHDPHAGQRSMGCAYTASNHE